MKVNDYFFDFLSACDDRREPYCILQGGRRSGKTWAIWQYLFLKLFEEGGDALVVSGTFARLRDTILRDAERIIMADGLPARVMYSPAGVVLNNGSRITFVGADRPTQGYSSVNRYVWLNEAIQIGETAAMSAVYAAGERCMMIADYNPYSRFWVNDRWETPTNKQISTWRHNLFLPSQARAELERREAEGRDAKAGTMARYIYEVECCGVDSSLSGRVFPLFEVVTDKEWEEVPAPVLIAADWGYTHTIGDPDALAAFKFVGDRIYIKELYYDNESTDAAISAVLKAFCEGRRERITGVYDPATNGETRIRNIISLGSPPLIRWIPAIKGQIVVDIRNICERTLCITETSPNALNEQREYVWEEKGGVLKPVDRYNHIMDGLRYAYNAAATRPAVFLR